MQALRATVRSCSPSRELIMPDLLPQLYLHWLLEDGIWATHREGSWGDSSDCPLELEVVIRGLSQIFSTGFSLESCITIVAQHYKVCVSKILPDAVTLSAPHPDHYAAQAAPQSLPTSDSSCPSSMPGYHIPEL